jgi:hypothetical protein
MDQRRGPAEVAAGDARGLSETYFFAEADKPIPAGKHQVRMEFKYDGGGLAKGGDVTLYYDGEAVGKRRVERSQPMGYSADEVCDVGSDSGSPASPDYGPSGNVFTGAIEWVQIDLGDDDHNHARGAVQDRHGAAVDARAGTGMALRLRPRPSAA